MIGVKDQNDKRDSLHHGGWVAKMVIWALLIVLMFFLPNVIISIFGEFYTCEWSSTFLLLCFRMKVLMPLLGSRHSLKNERNIELYL